ncbi:BTAD domain-containing putative transcriptional regulator [Kitasatospora sp. NPDC056184]|uniref:BTAD domain-containing putative transcriptional regulator n=1 Tax=Kitasatospora sp. NPDC056184 TaxID=3345738 RepID=UPI0035DD42DE
MRIGILGPLELRDTAARPVGISGQRLRSLLIRLALDGGRAVSAERLIADLWEDSRPAAPANALQTLVSRLRGAGGRDLVAAAPGGYRLGVDPGEIDAVAFERLVSAVRRSADPAERAATLRRALDLWRGPALAEVADAAFAGPAVTRLEELRLTAVEDRADAELALGDAAHLVAELDGLCRSHPLRERLRGLLMRALHATGRQAAALEVYEDTRRELAERLGADPSPDLAALHLAILRGDLRTAAPARAAAPGPGGGRRTNLPAPLTSFVGREEESGRIAALLREARLVTLTGPGGAGKTRLAGEVAAGLLGDHPDGVWLVPLAQVGSARDLPQAVLTAVGRVESSRVGDAVAVLPPMKRLVDALAGRRMLLVLDNCEHLVEAVARLADRVLAGAPGVRVLATSREPLAITGETLCPVPSLPLPPPGAGPAEAAGYAAVRLFADRAAAVRPGFRVDGTTAPLVVAVCRALDGLPFAIELAAARLRSLTLPQVAERLGDQFRLLGSGSRAAAPRHRTLRAVVDWSWELLDDTERAVLRRLSVFRGGATPRSAEVVCAPADDGAVDGRDVIDVIAALIDKSLVVATGRGEVRYGLLETVRAYAAERLAEAGETERLRAAHAARLLAVAERAEPGLRGAEQEVWAARLTAERDDCAAALGWAVERREAATALRLTGALMWYWIMHDRLAEAHGWAVAVHGLTGGRPPAGAPELADAYALCAFLTVLMTEHPDGPDGPDGPEPAAEARRRAVRTTLDCLPERPGHPALHLARPVAALFLNDAARAERELLAVREGATDPWVRAIARVCLGHLAFNAGRIDAALTELRAGHAGFRRLGDPWGMNTALGGLLELALVRGDAAEAVRLGQEAHAYAVRGGPEGGALPLIRLGRARAAAGDPARGLEEIRQGARTAERAGDFDSAVEGHVAVSRLLRAAGDLPGARTPLTRAVELLDGIAPGGHAIRTVALAYGQLGCLAEQEGDLAEAARWHAEAVRELGREEIVHQQAAAQLLEGVAALAAARGEPGRAAELLGAAHTLHGYRDDRSPEVRRAAGAVAAALDRSAAEAAYERGRRVPVEGALALAAGPS